MALQYGEGGELEVTLEGPFGSGGTDKKLTYINLLASNWKGGESPYSQVVTVEGVSVNSMVKLQESIEQSEIFRKKRIAFTTENDGGVVTAFAIGSKPTDDYIIQATIEEVIA